MLTSLNQVSKRELWNFLHKQGVEASKEEFLAFFDELDEGRTGSLSFKQFVTGIQGIRKVSYYTSFSELEPTERCVAGIVHFACWSTSLRTEPEKSATVSQTRIVIIIQQA